MSDEQGDEPQVTELGEAYFEIGRLKDEAASLREQLAEARAELASAKDEVAAERTIARAYAAEGEQVRDELNRCREKARAMAVSVANELSTK